MRDCGRFFRLWIVFAGLCALGAAIHSTCAAEPLPISADTRYASFGQPGDIDFAFGPPGSEQPPPAAEFKPMTRWHLPGSRQTLWLRFQVRFAADIKSDQKFFLEVDERPDKVKLFSGEPPAPEAASGVLIKALHRSWSDPRVLLPVTVHSGVDVTYLMAIEASVPFGTNLAIYSESELAASLWNQDLRLTLFAGFILALFLINFLLFAYTREKLYLYYSFLQPWYLIFPAWELGYGLFWGPWVVPWYQWIAHFSGALAVMALGLFGLKFTQIYSTNRRLYWAILGLAVVGPLLVLIIPMPSVIPSLAHMGVFVLLFACGVMAVRRGDRPARIWLAGMTMLIAGGFLFIAVEQGFLNLKVTLEDLVTILGCAMLIESVTFALSVSERLNDEAQDLMDQQSALIRRLEEQRQAAQSANMAKEQILLHTTSQLRAPLTVISGQADLLLDAGRGQDEDHASAIKDNAERLGGILQSLVEFSQTRKGPLVILPSAIDLCAVANEVVELLRPEARRLKTHIFNQCETSAPVEILADRERVRQILWTILGNAVRFTNDGYIHVGVECTDGIARLWVRDSGSGIDPSTQTRLFGEAESGADPQREAPAQIFSGSGLTLSGARELARRQGGDVRLAWSRPKVGSQFDVHLPLFTP